MILKMPKNNCSKTKLILSALAFTSLISSCAVGGLTSDYNKLTAKEKQRVVKSFGDIDQLKADNTHASERFCGYVQSQWHQSASYWQ